jgi:arabinose-5-phosphate isomerase
MPGFLRRTTLTTNKEGTVSRLSLACEVLAQEAAAIGRLRDGLTSDFTSFDQAVDLVLGIDQGQVVVTGMGKAGLIGAKISATLASTGTPSVTLHPAEAVHGDLGRIRANDIVIALSNSGETAEIRALIPAIRRIGAKVIAMTGGLDSSLAGHADCVLDIGQMGEACPLGLAPTASTSAMLALGDALAMVIQNERGFSREDFARFHPAGSLGRRLLRVGDVMRKGNELPLIPTGTGLREALVQMSKTPGRPGAGLIVNRDDKLIGIFTDGDLRRLFETDGHMVTDRLDSPVNDSMGSNPKTVNEGDLVDDAVRILHDHHIDQLAVVNEAGQPVGLLDIQDLLDVRI